MGSRPNAHANGVKQSGALGAKDVDSVYDRVVSSPSSLTLGWSAFRRDGWAKEVNDAFPNLTPEAFRGSPIRHPTRAPAAASKRKLVSHILVSDLLFSVTGFEQPAVARSFFHLIVVC